MSVPTVPFKKELRQSFVIEISRIKGVAATLLLGALVAGVAHSVGDVPVKIITSRA